MIARSYHCDVVKVDRKREETFDTGHAIVCLSDDNRLSCKQPVELVGESRGANRPGALFDPTTFPSHDLSGVDKHIAVDTNEKRCVNANHVGQIAAPCIEDCRGPCPVVLILRDVPHQGILPRGPGVVLKSRLVGARTAANNRSRALHRVLRSMSDCPPSPPLGGSGTYIGL